MRPIALALLFLTCSLAGQEVPDDPYAGLSPEKAAVERMLAERESLEALKAAIESARKVGASEQAVLEARFLFHVDRREDDALAALAPEFVGRSQGFKLEESEIFGVEEDWFAVVEYVQAIAALKQGDKAAFKKHITEAFWLSPQQGVAFAPHIERLRLDEAMEKVRVDFTKPLTTLDGEQLTLGAVSEGSKAIILHFWSPWSRECEATASDFSKSVEELEEGRVPVVSVIGEEAPEAAADTEAIFSAISEKPPGRWIIDPAKASLSRQLRIQNVPTMVLIGLDGRVLFNGHPASSQLWSELKKVSPAIKRPETGETH